MSRYVDFFIRSNGDEFIPLQDFSSMSEIYQHLNSHLQYGKVRALDREFLSGRIAALNQKKESVNLRIEYLKNEALVVMGANNPLQEKLDERRELLKLVEEYEEELDCLNDSIHFLDTLFDILVSRSYDKRYDEGKFLYAGLECDSPTVKDIAD